jgi:phosphatidylserine/phosphatidylglycerophosphate/cardiolipin synthase-like enzyme
MCIRAHAALGLLLASATLAGCTSSDVCFSPGGDCGEVVIEEMGHAADSIHVAMYSFTNETLATPLAEAQARGVDVKVALDWQDGGNTSIVDYLDGQSVPVLYSDNPNGLYGKLHHKFAVFDGKVVLTGSYNWSNTAEHDSDENLVRLVDPAMAERFESEFDRIWERGD